MPRSSELIRAMIVGMAMSAISSAAWAERIRVGTWNLGWHVSSAELPAWIEQCSKSFRKNVATGMWELAPAGAEDTRRGWDITESRARLEGVSLAVMPPCAVYMTPARVGIPVTPGSYGTRAAQIARLLREDVRADVIAFQEVSGTAAVREALGAGESDYDVCSFDGKYKVQRLAFAWRKALGPALSPCEDIREISLPLEPAERQVRPGYVVTLRLAGRSVRFMTLHLKSACVSPLDGGRLDGNRGADDPCPLLQQQVAPLESAFERLGQGVDHFVVLGDFNRNMWHEFHRIQGAEAVRSDGQTDLSKARPAHVATRNMLLEINDGAPASGGAVLLAASCRGSSDVAVACEAAKAGKLNAAQRKLLVGRDGLGCRNPVGLDHVLISEKLGPAVVEVVKVPIGVLGGSMAARPPQHPGPLLAISDHCPMVVELEL